MEFEVDLAIAICERDLFILQFLYFKLYGKFYKMEILATVLVWHSYSYRI